MGRKRGTGDKGGREGRREEKRQTLPSRRNWRYCSLLFLFSKAESRKEKNDESKNENSRKKTPHDN